MLYRRHLLKELTLTAAGVFFVLLLILISTQVINLLGRVSDGRVAADALFSLLAVWVLGLTPLLLILTVFISVLTVFSRYWRDGEMAVWLASGLSLKRWVRPLMMFVLPLTLLTGLVSLWAAPWAEARGSVLAQFLKQKQEMSLIKEGVFQSVGGRVYFVERFDPELGVAENVFVHEGKQTSDKDKTSVSEDMNNPATVIMARSGTLKNEGDISVLRLSDGYRLSGTPGSADFNRITFETARLLVAVNPGIDTETERGSASTAQLWRSDDPEWKAELMWRFAMPLTVPILALLALSLSYHNPRSGNTYNILLAMAVFFVYQNALSAARTQIAAARLSPLVGSLAVHMLMLLFAWWWLSRRNGDFLREKKR